MFCPNCGMENPDTAVECRRCHVPFQEEEAPPPSLSAEQEESTHVDPALQAEPQGSDAFGSVCRRCEAFNEPGVARCTSCGYKLVDDAPPAEAPAADAGGEERTPPQGLSHAEVAAAEDDQATLAASAVPDRTPPQAHPSLSDELQALALSDEDARDALGSGRGEPAPDATPPDGVPAVAAEPEPAPPPPARKPAPAAAPTPPPPAAAAADKTCESCGVVNPPNAKFCSECGTPFKKAAAPAAPKAPPKSAPAHEEEPQTDPSARKAKKALEATAEQPPVSVPPEPPPAPARPARGAPEGDSHLPSADLLAQLEAERAAMKAAAKKAAAPPPPAIEVAEDLTTPGLEEPPAAHAPDALPEVTPAEPQPVPEELAAAEVELPPEGAPLEAAAPEEAAVEEAPPPEPVEEAPPPVEEPPFQVQLTVEKGEAAGTALVLSQLESGIGGPGAAIDLGVDPHLAALQATLAFQEQKLVLRDEGAANGVYVKVRESARLDPGDCFIAGERLLRFDGPVELPTGGGGDTPLQGAPRPQGPTLRVTEVLKGGRTGRTCHRSGPVIAVGKAGCDLNFPSDALLGARHAEIHLDDAGAASVHDLGAAPCGVFVRVKPRGTRELQAGDVLQLGDQQLRVDL